MSRIGLIIILLSTLLLVCGLESGSPHCDGSLRYLGEDDWQDVLKGKWVVKFYAQWCPACKSFKTDWEELALEFYNEGYCVASADVSANAGLSGRFFVTSLPTFYIIQDGEIRMYTGPRSKADLTKYVLEEGWKDTPVVPWYISPTSYHMAALGSFFRFSMALRNLHTTMTEDYGVPAWISYISFACLTIFLGLLIGLVMVFLCDVGFGPASPKRVEDTFVVGADDDFADDNDVEDVAEEEEFGKGEGDDDDDDDDEKDKEGEDDDDDDDDDDEKPDGKESEADDETEKVEEEEDDGEGITDVRFKEESGEPRRRAQAARGAADGGKDELK